MKTLRTLFTMMLLVVASSMSAQMRMVKLNRTCIYADPVTAIPGKQCDLVISLKDVDVPGSEITGWQFTLTLPKGVSIATEPRYDTSGNIDGYYVKKNSYSMSEEMYDDDNIWPVQNLSGEYVFWWVPQNYRYLLSNTGEIIRITLDVSPDFVSGIGEITNPHCSECPNTLLKNC